MKFFSMLRIIVLSLLLVQSAGFAEGAFRPFTAQVSKKKVRLRTKPELDAPIVRELVAGDLMIVDGEEGQFYQIRPPSDLKLYLFRTFVLDGMIEGNRVNVRLAPDLESAIVAQLNTGDRVIGEVSSLHPKWMEIKPPETVRFYIAKDFAEEVGDEHYLALHEAKCKEVRELLARGDSGRNRLSAPFEAIVLDEVLAPFQEIISRYAEFSAEVALAEDAIADIRHAYLLKKVAYLEEKSSFSPSQATAAVSPVLDDALSATTPIYQANPRAYWVEAEKIYYKHWVEKKGETSVDAFIQAQAKLGESLKGVIEPYFRPVNKKPGDYVLVNPKTGETLAYLYATKYSLQDYFGREVEFIGVKRPNNQFAYPAYYVLEIKTCLEDSSPSLFGD